MKKPIKILLVEDNPGDAQLIQEMLKEDDKTYFQVTHTPRLDEGLTHLLKAEFDIMLLDLCLPDSMGIDTFNVMKYNAPEMPIIVLTGLKDDIFAVSAVGRGAQDYLVKGDVKSKSLARSILDAIANKEKEKKEH